MWQLLVHSDEDLRDFAGDAVRAACLAAARTTRPIKAGNLAEALQNLEDWRIADCDLVIIEATAPATRKASIGGAAREPVFEFIRRLKTERTSLPVIVLAPSPDELLRIFLTAYDATAHVELLPGWREELQQRAEELLLNVPPAEKACLELDITLAGSNRTNWRIHRTGDSSFHDFGELYVDAEDLKRLVRRSQSLAKLVQQPDWQSELCDLSVELVRLLFENAHLNRKLWHKFVNHRAQVGGVENTRVRVTLNDDTHPVMVEALKDDDDPAFWMLKAPIFRRYESPMARPPLFKDSVSRKGPINILVLQADPAPGNVPDGPWAGRLNPLPEIEAEADDLIQIFERAREANGGGVIDRLSIADIDGDPVGAVLGKLRERAWHIVHFCGHGAVSDTNDAALILAPERGGVLRVADLADKLFGTQFLFLNCCQSADSYFIMRAVQNFVPALLGFRWVVPDRSAASVARAFYQALFARGQASYKYVEYAFMCARRAIHDRDSSDPTWASPLLVMQLP